MGNAQGLVSMIANEMEEKLGRAFYHVHGRAGFIDIRHSEEIEESQKAKSDRKSGERIREKPVKRWVGIISFGVRTEGASARLKGYLEAEERTQAYRGAFEFKSHHNPKVAQAGFKVISITSQEGQHSQQKVNLEHDLNLLKHYMHEYASQQKKKPKKKR